MDTVLQDLRYAVRQLRRSPAFTMAATYLPARRVTRADPMTALRAE